MDHELQRQMAAFDAARIRQPIELSPFEPKRILVARDGSNQDATALALAGAIAKRHGAEVGEWHGPVGELAHESILTACEAADLLLLPCPFGADFAAVGKDTLSAIVDLLVARGRIPVICVRGPLADVDAALDRPLVALDMCRERKVEATAMALGLSRSGGEVAMLAVTDPAEPIRRQEILSRWLDPADLDQDDLTALHGARTASLTAALQRAARSRGIGAKVQLRAGSALDVTCEEAVARGGIIVSGAPRDHRDAAFGRVRELILASALPVALA